MTSQLRVHNLPSDWHSETWAEVVDTLRDHFSELGFETRVHPTIGTLTIIHGTKALTVMNTTGTHFDEQARLVFHA